MKQTYREKLLEQMIEDYAEYLDSLRTVDLRLIDKTMTYTLDQALEELENREEG